KARKTADKLREKYKNNTDGYKDKCKARRIATAYMKLSMDECFFCKDATIEMHHPDYSLPEVVYPLCKKCHIKLHTLLLLEGRKIQKNASK
ncbi:hypothetical protein LCGC14_2349250, partial [marine sediment metagenome]